MVRKVLHAFSLALANIRSNLFHTLLSVLGIVIGVAALVSILSLIDGMEQFARDQIATTTSLNGIIVQSEPYKMVNNVRLRKDTVPVINYDDYKSIASILTKPVKSHIRWSSSLQVQMDMTRIGTMLLATAETLEPGTTLKTGAFFTDSSVNSKEAVAVVNPSFLKAAGISSAEEALGKQVKLRAQSFTINGVTANEMPTPKVFIPITFITEKEFQANTPDVLMEAEKTEDIPTLKTEIADWLKAKHVHAIQDFKIITNDFRIEQTARGFLLFRIIMGLIVGISVIVGGIGVMNVLLISVTERTAEIGIRKAMGANRRDIVLLFLTESVTVSAFGSLVGLIVGVLGTMAIIPIVKAITKVPFQAAYTVNTFIVISIVAMLVGIIFGTYPALRASRLDPVEAIRHE
jgi:putative ABC transport system permease protein